MKYDPTTHLCRPNKYGLWKLLQVTLRRHLSEMLDDPFYEMEREIEPTARELLAKVDGFIDAADSNTLGCGHCDECGAGLRCRELPDPDGDG